jgi:AraC-like DNA-binding protein
MLKRTATENRFSEALTWSQVSATWKQLYGAFQRIGVSFEWHELATERPFDWSKSFHPESVEICLNLAGSGFVQNGRRREEVRSQTALFYWTGTDGVKAERFGGEKHEFLTVEFSPGFIEENFQKEQPGLHRVAQAALRRGAPEISGPERLTSQHHDLIRSLRRPPVYQPAQHTWFQAKALEIAALFLFEPPPEQELFCHRQQFLARERVEKVQHILRESLAEPPGLDEIAKRVGCSSFYLSRIFSKETGSTIPQYLRQLRMEKAAELLRSGKFNVTEAAFEVGYSSLSHFSQAFHETFGCCPGLYPVFPKANGAKGGR